MRAVQRMMRVLSAAMSIVGGVLAVRAMIRRRTAKPWEAWFRRLRQRAM
ncbi:MAG: hypothetical protein QJR06_02970 [Alicyclobacillaceae bacterium]|nr:hypothetical protein [Alicyclobacillaceae bacterium]